MDQRPDADSDSRTKLLQVPTDVSAVERRKFLAAIGGSGAVLLAGCPQVTDNEVEVETYLLIFTDDGEDFEVEVQEDEEIMYPALDAGVDIPYSCEVGRCGLCTVKYDGDANTVVEHDGNEYLTDEQIEAGWVLTCVAYSRADAEFEVAHPEDE